jgi:type I restriction enzyme S subunit
MELKPGYKQTEVGGIPEDWEIKQLGSIAVYNIGILSIYLLMMV